MRILAWDKKLKEDVALNQVPSILKNKGTVWMDIEQPTPEAMAQLQSLFEFHPLTVEDCLEGSPLPKIDEYDQYAFVSINRLSLGGDTVRVDSVYFYLSSNYIISIRREKSSSVDQVHERILKNPDLLKRGPDFVLYSIIDQITDRYLEVLAALEKEVQDLETRVLKGKLENSLSHILKTRRTLGHFKKSLMPQRDLVGKLARRDTRFVKMTSLMYFRDISDQVLRALTLIEGLRETLTGTFEAYLSIYSNRLNEIMKTLTVFATIFLPLTFLTGVYGMNFRAFPELGWEHGYYAFWGVSAFIVFLMLVYFKRKNYL